MAFLKEIKLDKFLINIFFILLGFSFITFFKGYYPQIIGKIFILLSIIVFFSLLIQQKKFLFLRRYLIFSLLFYLFFYLSNFTIGDIPTIDFFKKINQILICILIFSAIYFEKLPIKKIEIATFIALGIGIFVILILFFHNKLNLNILPFFEIFFSHKVHLYDNEVIKKSLLEDSFLRNNPYCILLNVITLYYLIQNKFTSKSIIILLISSTLLFLSSNVFSKYVQLSIIFFFIIKNYQIGFLILKFFILSLLIFFLFFFFILDLQLLINLINIFFSKIFLYLFDVKKNLIYNYLVIYNDEKELILKIISLSNFEFFSEFDQENLINDNYEKEFQYIRNFYYDYYLGGIFRIGIIKFKLMYLPNESFVNILNSPFILRLFGGNNLNVYNTFDPQTNFYYFDLISKLKNNYYDEICLQKKMFDDISCLNNLISKDYPSLIFNFESASNIKQKLTSTHNSFLTFIILINKFYIILIINLILCSIFLLMSQNKDLVFFIISFILIFFFEDYLFFNRYNISIFSWIVVAISLKLIIQKRIY